MHEYICAYCLKVIADEVIERTYAQGECRKAWKAWKEGGIT